MGYPFWCCEIPMKIPQKYFLIGDVCLMNLRQCVQSLFVQQMEKRVSVWFHVGRFVTFKLFWIQKK